MCEMGLKSSEHRAFIGITECNMWMPFRESPASRAVGIDTLFCTLSYMMYTRRPGQAARERLEMAASVIETIPYVIQPVNSCIPYVNR